MSACRAVVAGGLPGTFLDVTFMSTPEAAAAVNKLNLHVLIDVNGHTQCAGSFYTRTTARAHTSAHTRSHARTLQSQTWHALIGANGRTRCVRLKARRLPAAQRRLRYACNAYACSAMALRHCRAARCHAARRVGTLCASPPVARHAPSTFPAAVSESPPLWCALQYAYGVRPALASVRAFRTPVRTFRTTVRITRTRYG